MQQKRSKKIYYSTLLLLCGVFIMQGAMAQENDLIQEVRYGDAPIIDSDLDGLTDLGEEQIFHTNPTLPDTDNDGFFDGVEVIMGSDPLTSVYDEAVADARSDEQPFAWYISRITGLIAYALLWVVLLFGFSFRTPFLKKIVAPAYKLDLHIYLSVLAFVFILTHAFILLFDHLADLSLADILIPYHVSTPFIDPAGLAAGIIAFYIFLIIIITSLLRKHLPHGLWRGLHFFHALLYILVVLHALQMGTDIASGWPRTVFLLSVGVMAVLYPIGLYYTIRDMMVLRKKKSESKAKEISKE